MSLPQKIGTLLAQGLRLGTIQTPRESLKMTANGWEHRISFVAPWVGMEGLIPARFSQDPKYPGLYLMDDVDCEKWMGNLVKMDIVYRTPDYPITDGTGTPPDENHESPSTQDVKIQFNPRYPGNSGDNTILAAWLDPNSDVPPFAKSSPLYGTDSYYYGVKSVTYKEYFPRLSATLDNTTIQDAPDPLDYVKIADPPGYETSGCSLRLTSEVNPDGLWWIRESTYLFSETAWPVSVYGAAEPSV